MMSRETHGYERVLNNVSACRMPFWARPTTPRLRRNTWQVSSLAIPFRENQKRNCVCAQTRQVENHQFMMMRASSSLSSSFTCLCVLYLYILHFHITACMVCVPFGLFRGVGIFPFFSPLSALFSFCVCVCVARRRLVDGSEMRPGLRNPEFPDIFSSGNSSFGLCIYMGSIPGAPSSINRFLRFPSSSFSSSSPHSAALSSFPLQDPILIYLFMFIYFLFFSRGPPYFWGGL